MKFLPLTPTTWSDFEELFGEHGAYGGCWCMWWRLKRRDFEAQKGQGNRRAMKALVDRGQVPGILGYQGDRALAWCSVAPREEFGALERSRVLARIDDAPVWSIVCFFIARSHRGRGLTGELIPAAVEHARRNGASIVEAYPTIPRSDRVAPVSSFMGFPETLARAGFLEVARPSRAKCIMRYVVE
jgi:GNAT superfamily N-acetyltransferase